MGQALYITSKDSYISQILGRASAT